MQKLKLTIIFLFITCFAFAQSNDSLLNIITKNNQLHFYLKNIPTQLAFILPLDKPILTIADTRLTKAKQKLGSIKLKWKDSQSTDYYFNFYDKNQHFINLKSKKDTINLNFEIIEYDNNYTFKFIYNSINYKSIKKSGDYYKKITWCIPFLENEDIYGGGEQFSFVNVKGRKIPYLVEEQGIGRGDEPISSVTRLGGASGDKTSTFMPLARFLTSQKRVITDLLSSYNYKIFNFSEKNILLWHDYVKIGHLGYQIIIPKGNKWQIVNQFQPQPSFMFKTILGLQGGTDTVLRKLKVLTDAGVNPSALWIQDWCGRRVTPFGKQLLWNWQLDTLRYLKFENFKVVLKTKNIKLLAYINPFLAENTVLAKKIIDLDSLNQDLTTKILIQNDKNTKPYLMKATGFKVHLFNFKPTNYTIFDIMKKEMIEKGFSGWMADFGEWYPIKIDKKGIKSDNLSKHNYYTDLWSYHQYFIKNEHLNTTNDTLGIFMRSSTMPSGHIYWAGDQNTNWGKNDGLPSLVPALLSSGLSGIGINHGDIGGFTSFKKPGFAMLRDRELLYRWIELCAFTPIFRTHEGLAPDYNLQVYSDADAAVFFAKFSAIHDDLHGYIMRTYHEIETEHLPMIRHLIIKYPDDLNVRNLDYQFMLGNDILVIPVLEHGAKTVRGYLPAGKWQHFFTKEILESKGEWRVFDAPLGKPCVWKVVF